MTMKQRTQDVMRTKSKTGLRPQWASTMSERRCSRWRQTLVRLFFFVAHFPNLGWFVQSLRRWERSRTPSSASLRSAQLPKVEMGMFEFAYETAKGVNIHFYLLSKLFMSISSSLYTNKWGKGGEGCRTSEMDKQGLCHRRRLRLCSTCDCGGKEYFIERSLWREHFVSVKKPLEDAVASSTASSQCSCIFHICLLLTKDSVHFLDSFFFSFTLLNNTGIFFQSLRPWWHFLVLVALTMAHDWPPMMTANMSERQVVLKDTINGHYRTIICE